MPPRRRKPLPMLMSEPSPALASINRMNQEQLAERIESLQRESENLLNKIDRLNDMNPPPDEKIKNLAIQVERLKALENIAKDRLSGKQERSTQRSSGPNPGNSSGGYGNQGGNSSGNQGGNGNSGNSGGYGNSRGYGSGGYSGNRPGGSNPRRY
jgi:hypothetical protein